MSLFKSNLLCKTNSFESSFYSHTSEICYSISVFLLIFDIIFRSCFHVRKWWSRSVEEQTLWIVDSYSYISMKSVRFSRFDWSLQTQHSRYYVDHFDIHELWLNTNSNFWTLKQYKGFLHLPRFVRLCLFSFIPWKKGNRFLLKSLNRHSHLNTSLEN